LNLVLDSSFTGTLFLPDEMSGAVSDFLLKQKNAVYTVPLLWWYELSNILIVAVKRKRLHHLEAEQVLSLFKSMNLVTDVTFGADYSFTLLQTAQIYNLSAYDSAYLELCLREKCALATLDNELMSAASKAGVSCLKI
jgi:predicted nucleic acid-binding protein